MEDRTLFIHIGNEKTGSTSLQKFLSQNSEALKERGFLYPGNPTSAYFEGTGHFPIAGSLLPYEPEFVTLEKVQRLKDAVSEFVRDVSESAAANVIISSEHFSSRVTDKATLLDFKNLLAATFRKIAIVCYIRDQPALAISAYSTMIVSGERARFAIDKITPDNRYFDPLSVLELWSSVFGEQAMIVQEYSKEKLTGGDICSDFCGAIGLSTVGLIPANALNVSHGRLNLELLRQMNGLLPTFTEDSSAWRTAQRLRGLVLQHLVIPDNSTLTLSKAECDQILRRFKDRNAELNRRFMDGTLSERWFSQQAIDAEEPEIAAAQEFQAQPQTEELIRTFTATLIALARTLDRERTFAKKQQEQAGTSAGQAPVN